MVGFVKKKISNKILFALFILMSLNSILVVLFTANSVYDDSIKTSKTSLSMLNEAMFQSLQNAMITGNPIEIKRAEEDARQIDGVKRLIVAKSQPLIDLYAPTEKITTDPSILKTFKDKQEQFIENGEELRMIKPMIAKQDCLLCHANQQEGDIIGVIDLTFSLQDTFENLETLIVSIFIVSIILGLLSIGLIFYIVKKTTNPIDSLKKGFENLISSNNSNIKLDIKSTDEIGDVANLFNQYMDKVNKGLKQDSKVIEEANNTLELTSKGYFTHNVTNIAANPHVEDLKNKLNYMINHTKETLDKINFTLKGYSNSNFDTPMDDKNIEGDLGFLAQGIKQVGNSTSKMLSLILDAGDMLNNQTNGLSNASSILSTTSNRQATSLQESVASLENVTNNIKETTKITSQMVHLAKDVTISAKNGLDLATQTAKAMDNINEEVNSINEAIEVIDQIAFQTNILSLNAAVEAATAGEAGKGFAVVAQEVRNLASRSAEAAKEIKEIVEKASAKANIGKDISSSMIKGYDELNKNINTTIAMIEDVTQSSKEQEKSIVQINESIHALDKLTQENATEANNVSSMSKQIDETSNSLVALASKATFIRQK